MQPWYRRFRDRARTSGVVDQNRSDNPLMAWAALALLVAEIHDLEDHEHALDDLLTEFERAAWPSPRAQRQ